MTSPKQTARQWFLPIMMTITLALLTGAWWTVGLLKLWEPEAINFSTERRQTFEFIDTSFNTAMVELFPTRKLENPDVFTGHITLKVKDLSEAEAMPWIARLCEVRLVCTDKKIIVSTKPWHERHYEAVAQWFRELTGVSLWPNR